MVNSFILSVIPRRLSNTIINHVQRRYMPVNVPPTATGKRRFRLAVETDPHKLVNNCCGLNYHKDEPLIKLKPDEEYPDWLWDLRLGEKPNSWEMEKGTKEYYLRLKEEQNYQNYVIRIKKRREFKLVGKEQIKQAEYLKFIKFAALAHMEEDAGLDMQEIGHDWKQKYQELVHWRDYYLPPEEGRVLYTDKLKGNIHIKNFFRDDESSFKSRITTERRPPLKLQPVQDSKRRHTHASN